MNVASHTLFAEHYVANPTTQVSPPEEAASLEDIQVLMSKDLGKDLKAWEERQYERIGTVEFVGKGNLGIGTEARTQAKTVGATVVLFRLWPAKLKAIRRTEDGSIDIDAVVADPPAGLSPRGYYVLRAAFLRPNWVRAGF